MIYSDNIKISKNGLHFTDKHGQTLSLDQAMAKVQNRIKNWFDDSLLYFIHAISCHMPLFFIRKAIFEAAGVKIGLGSTIHMGCRFFNPSGVRIGVDTKIGDNAFLDGRAELVIGDHVDLASQVLIYNSEHDHDSKEFKATIEPVSIGDYVFVGPRSIILPGVKIGRGAVVAAGAVVTANVEDFAIVGGVPARKIGERKNRELHYKLGRARLFQ